MYSVGALALVIGGTLSALAAVAHLACIVLGPAAYRFMGAGERMVRAVEAGKSKPIVVTGAIAVLLFAWAAYAFSGAGLIGHLPLTDLALPAIGLVYLVRALGFPLLKPLFPENSTTFWLVSSSICLVLGLLYAAGTIAVWSE